MYNNNNKYLQLISINYIQIIFVCIFTYVYFACIYQKLYNYITYIIMYLLCLYFINTTYEIYNIYKYQDFIVKINKYKTFIKTQLNKNPSYIYNIQKNMIHYSMELLSLYLLEYDNIFKLKTYIYKFTDKTKAFAIYKEMFNLNSSKLNIIGLSSFNSYVNIFIPFFEIDKDTNYCSISNVVDLYPMLKIQYKDITCMYRFKKYLGLGSFGITLLYENIYSRDCIQLPNIVVKYCINKNSYHYDYTVACMTGNKSGMMMLNKINDYVYIMEEGKIRLDHFVLQNAFMLKDEGYYTQILYNIKFKTNWKRQDYIKIPDSLLSWICMCCDILFHIKRQCIKIQNIHPILFYSDLKMENIVFDNNFYPRLIDLESAYPSNEYYTTTFVIDKSKLWISKEDLIKNKKIYTYRLLCFLYCAMITGNEDILDNIYWENHNTNSNVLDKTILICKKICQNTCQILQYHNYKNKYKLYIFFLQSFILNIN